jgi:hypothetical protein
MGYGSRQTGENVRGTKHCFTGTTRAVAWVDWARDLHQYDRSGLDKIMNERGEARSRRVSFATRWHCRGADIPCDTIVLEGVD